MCSRRNPDGSGRLNDFAPPARQAWGAGNDDGQTAEGNFNAVLPEAARDVQHLVLRSITDAGVAPNGVRRPNRHFRGAGKIWRLFASRRAARVEAVGDDVIGGEDEGGSCGHESRPVSDYRHRNPVDEMLEEIFSDVSHRQAMSRARKWSQLGSQ
mmetsp:Transcript_5471/g.15324  ORF Transcript_5471/g.15324 Transcript_5471/m.15324 type:complete len:155 (+) Transcript_5471:43-507(+)